MNSHSLVPRLLAACLLAAALSAAAAARADAGSYVVVGCSDLSGGGRPARRRLVPRRGGLVPQRLRDPRRSLHDDGSPAQPVPLRRPGRHQDRAARLELPRAPLGRGAVGGPDVRGRGRRTAASGSTSRRRVATSARRPSTSPGRGGAARPTAPTHCGSASAASWPGRASRAGSRGRASMRSRSSSTTRSHPPSASPHPPARCAARSASTWRRATRAAGSSSGRSSSTAGASRRLVHVWACSRPRRRGGRRGPSRARSTRPPRSRSTHARSRTGLTRWSRASKTSPATSAPPRRGS